MAAMAAVRFDEVDALKHAAPVQVETTTSTKPFSVEPLKSTESQGVVYLNAGGPVWAVDWFQPTSSPNKSYIAVSAHPTQVSADGETVMANHSYNNRYDGANVVQIWSSTAGSKAKKDASALVLTIPHNGGFAWTLKWAPHACASLPLGLGVLAAALGDGSLHLYRFLNDHTYSVLGSYTDPHSSLLSISWSRTHPYMFLTGRVDGAIHMWNMQDVLEQGCSSSAAAASPATMAPHRCFEDADSMSKQPQHHWGRGWVAVREIEWSPHDPYLFCSMGNDTTLRIWDLREPRACLRAHRLVNFTFGLAVFWFNPTTIFVSTDQGSVFGVDPFTGMQRLLLTHPHLDSPVWSFTSARCTADNFPVMLSACASGTVLQSRLDRLSTKRSSPTSVVQLQLAPKSAGLRVSFAKVARKGTATNGKREFPDRQVAIHRVQFSPSGTHVLWAGASGLVGIAPYTYSVPRGVSGKPIGRPRKHDINSKKGRRKKPLKHGRDNDDVPDFDDEDDEESAATSGSSDDDDAEVVVLSDGDDDDGVAAADSAKRPAAERTVATRKKAKTSYAEHSEGEIEILDDDDEEVKEADEAAAVGKSPRGRSKKAPAAAATPPPKKRGRPKKEVVETPVAKGPLDSFFSPKSAKRPPTTPSKDVQVVSPTKAAAKAPTPELPVKKRGRPKKDAIAAPQDGEAAIPAAAPSTGKAKQGATATSAAVTVKKSTKTATSVKPPPPTDSDDDVVLVPAVAEPKKRGRPPGKAKALVKPSPSPLKKPTQVLGDEGAGAKAKATTGQQSPSATRKSPARAGKKMVQTKLQLFKAEAPASPAKAPPVKRDVAATNPPPSFVVGQVVHVAARTTPGVNKLGGAGRVKAVNADGTVDVKYVLGGQERGVAIEFVAAGTLDAPDADSTKRRRRG